MIQTKTKIVIKDNSDFLNAYCINNNRSRGGATVGNCIKVSISKIKPLQNTSIKKVLTEKNAKKSLQNLLIIQSSAPLLRGDGASLHFDCNSGVSILLKKTGRKRQYQLGFKRIHTAVPFELKNKERTQKLKGVPNVVKLATHLL